MLGLGCLLWQSFQSESERAQLIEIWNGEEIFSNYLSIPPSSSRRMDIPPGGRCWIRRNISFRLRLNGTAAGSGFEQPPPPGLGRTSSGSHHFQIIVKNRFSSGKICQPVVIIDTLVVVKSGVSRNFPEKGDYPVEKAADICFLLLKVPRAGGVFSSKCEKKRELTFLCSFIRFFSVVRGKRRSSYFSSNEKQI